MSKENSLIDTADNPARNNSLDGVRALATLLIITYHLFYASGQTYNNANGLGQFSSRLNVAVSIFFVLSGYLLFKPFVQALFLDTPLPQTHSFYLKRFVRILPAYWVALLILLKIDAVDFPNISGFVRSFFLVHTFTLGNVFTGIQQTWTLSVEVFFYLCLPGIAILIRANIRNKTSKVKMRNIFVFLIVLYILSYSFRIFFHQVNIRQFETYGLLLPAHLDAFALGMCIATVIAALEVFPHLKTYRAQLIRMNPIFFLISGATWFWSTQIGMGVFPNTPPFQIDLFCHFLDGISSVTFVLPFCINQDTSRIVKIFGSQACVWLGTISYGMYLWHFLFLEGQFADTYLPYRVGDMGIATRLVVTVSGTIALGAVSYYFIERPLIRTLSREIQKRKIQNQLARSAPRITNV